MSKKIAPKISKEELEKLYSEKSPNEISLMFNVSRPTILRWLGLYEIEKRDHSKATEIVTSNQTGRQRKGYEEAHKQLDDYDWLMDQRVNQKKSIRRIAKELDVSYTLVKKYLRKYEFEIGERVDRVPIETIKKLKNKDFLLNLYNQGLTLEKIADTLGTSKSTLSIAFFNLGIETKDRNFYDQPFHKISSGHQEIIDFIKENYDGIIKVNDRQTTGTELDIYLPEKNFAIEFNGLFYHSEEGGKGQYYHLNKTKICEKNDIFLFHIFEDSWRFKKEIIKSMIINKLGRANKIYARKCQIKIVDNIDRNHFFENNHIQGRDYSTISYGLYFQGELVACMSFSKSRWNDNFTWELMRFANKINTTVVGGFSKLLKYFRNNYFGSIISYSDISYASGNVYNKNGFILDGINVPNYFYVDKNYITRENRIKFNKNNLKKKYPDIDITKTENELTKELGFKRIWNCGTIRWSLQ